MKLIPLPEFQDNDLWMLHDVRPAPVVGPGDAQPVHAALQQHGLQQEAILVTHHHAERDAMRDATGASVFGPRRESIPGPLFEGTPARKLAFLHALAALPAQTRVCCTHEYANRNLNFALAVGPGAGDLVHYAAHCRRARARGKSTPSRIGLERRINSFLRTRIPRVVEAARAHDANATDDVGGFAAVRP